MGRRKAVTSITLPPTLVREVEAVAKKRGWNRSETIRHIVSSFLTDKASEQDLGAILRSYWETRAKTRERIIVVAVGIIVKGGKVLIGLRRKKDPDVEELTWVFPGGGVSSLIFTNDLMEDLKLETGLEVDVKSLISARVHPDSGFKPTQIVVLYFYCEPTGGKLKSGDDLKELKWVKPMDVFKYFTTSTNDEVTKFLSAIQKSEGV